MIDLPSSEMLLQLGSGTSIDQLLQDHQLTREQFDLWWAAELARRVPDLDSTLLLADAADVTIHRDRLGIPHLVGDTDEAIFYGFGLAMAQDRLFQLDYLRRKALGRLSEILGPAGLESDRTVRTIGLNHIAQHEWQRLDEQTQQLVDAYCRGVNAVISSSRQNLPIEFDLLGYQPELWRPEDCLAIESEFRWYLTGRFPVIVIPELAYRTLGEGPLYEQLLEGEEDSESIMPAGSYPPGDGDPEAVGHVMSQPDEGIGSNNWVIAANRTSTGSALVASDPHIAFEAVSCWYEVHLAGGSFNVAGMAYVGMPVVMFGRNEQVGWAITNNICSQRDLYQERPDPDQPGSYMLGDQSIPASTRIESIAVAGEADEELAVVTTHNGPLVQDILPPEARDTGPVSIKWVGAYQGGWLQALLDMGRATDVASFQEAARPWHVPTFSVMVGDTEGQVGFLATGRVPLRTIACRGYRPGWDPQHQWQGYIPFEGMPRLQNPEQGWIASANNRVAPPDYPFPMAGCWISGHRAVRIRQMIEQQPQLSLEDCKQMQYDVLSGRAVATVPLLVEQLKNHEGPEFDWVIDTLEAWDCRSTADSAAAAIFNIFFRCWCRRIASERFPASQQLLLSRSCLGLAGRLLQQDQLGWFANGNHADAVRETMLAAIVEATELLGEDTDKWQWGSLHKMSLRHVLSTRGELGSLLDQPAVAVNGDMVTVGNTGEGPNFEAMSGGGYRLLHDMGSSPPEMLAMDGQSQSGHPGSPHYADQFNDWVQGNYHSLPLSLEGILAAAVHTQIVHSE